MLNEEGEVEMDSVVMEGRELKAGSIACVKNIKNPVKLARLVLEKVCWPCFCFLGVCMYNYF